MNLLVEQIRRLCSELSPHANVWEVPSEEPIRACDLDAKDRQNQGRVYQTPFQSIHD